MKTVLNCKSCYFIFLILVGILTVLSKKTFANKTLIIDQSKKDLGLKYIKSTQNSKLKFTLLYKALKLNAMGQLTGQDKSIPLDTFDKFVWFKKQTKKQAPKTSVIKITISSNSNEMDDQAISHEFSENKHEEIFAWLNQNLGPETNEEFSTELFDDNTHILLVSQLKDDESKIESALIEKLKNAYPKVNFYHYSKQLKKIADLQKLGKEISDIKKNPEDFDKVLFIEDFNFAGGKGYYLDFYTCKMKTAEKKGLLLTLVSPKTGEIDKMASSLNSEIDELWKEINVQKKSNDPEYAKKEFGNFMDVLNNSIGKMVNCRLFSEFFQKSTQPLKLNLPVSPAPFVFNRFDAEDGYMQIGLYPYLRQRGDQGFKSVEMKCTVFESNPPAFVCEKKLTHILADVPNLLIKRVVLEPDPGAFPYIILKTKSTIKEFVKTILTPEKGSFYTELLPGCSPQDENFNCVIP